MNRRKLRDNRAVIINTKTFSNPNIDPSDDDVKTALSNIGIHAVARQQAAEHAMFSKIEAKEIVDSITRNPKSNAK